MGNVGSALSRTYHGYLSRNERRLLLLGLDGSGKTTIAKYVRSSLASNKTGSGDSAPTAPSGPGSPGFTVDTFKHAKLVFHLWDVGGEEKLRPYWRHYYTGTQGVLFVVDASDRERLPLAALELRTLANDEQLAEAVIAVAVNKTDAPGALSLQDVQKGMDLATILKGHRWRAEAVDPSTGNGLERLWNHFAEFTRPI